MAERISMMRSCDKDYLAVLAASIEGATGGLDVAWQAKNIQLAALHGRQLFKAHLVIGLVKWRQGGSPVEDFEQAIRMVDDVSQMIQEWDSSFDAAAGLPIAGVGLVSRLLGGAIESPHVGVAADSSLSADTRLDLLLAGDLAADDTERTAAALIAELSANTRAALAAESYKNYFEIVARAANADQLEQLAEQGNILFMRRARDYFFSDNNQSEGGGDDNACVVDYRLAVALKKANYSGASMHAWKW